MKLALRALTANLLLAAGAHAGVAADPSSDLADDTGLTRIDAAVLFYKEAGGRIRATEPVVAATLNGTGGGVLSVKLTETSLTGATPNGATAATRVQTFVAPASAPGSTTTVTSPSGRSRLVVIPGTGVVTRQYDAAAGVLPMDYGFHDRRTAFNVGYSAPFGEASRWSAGAAYSHELDYRSYDFNFGVSRDFNHRNTTVSAMANLEFDQSKPQFGDPEPLTPMSGTAKGGGDSKTVSSLLIGVTQVMSRRWITQLSYNIGKSEGYQTDPYRVVSVLDSTTGDPLTYLYEGRPRSRLRQSLYWGNKVSVGPTVTDVSVRGYHDDWGITSFTGEIAERVDITRWFYVEPSFRYYQQSAADFFVNYLKSGDPTPAFASSDSRLGKFDATTVGVKLGFKVLGNGELYCVYEDYKQNGKGPSANTDPAFALQNQFTGVDAKSAMVGYTFAFY